MPKTNQQIKLGYKNSPLGPIPEDWQIVTLGKLGETYSGLSGKDKDDFGSGKSYIPYMNVFGNTIIDNSFMDLVEILDDDNQNTVKFGDIFFTTSSENPEEVGMCSTYLGYEDNIYLNSFCFGFRFSNLNDYSSLYFSYLFRSGFGRRIIYKLAQGSTRYNISKSGLLNSYFPIPKIEEQQAIAKILKTTDDTINSTEVIIKKLELRNKGLQQRLLTGKTRIEGFSYDWGKFHIKDFAKEISVRNRTNKELTVLSCTKYDGLVPSLQYFGRKIYSDDLSTYKIVPKNTFAYATNHIEEGSIGYQNIMEEGLISPMYTVFITNNSVCNEYLYKLFKTPHMIYEYQSRMEGSIDRRGGLRWEEFSNIKLRLPRKDEQEAIMEVLNKAEKELDLYKQKLEKLNQVKKGLMQQLLTGKVRVKF